MLLCKQATYNGTPFYNGYHISYPTIEREYIQDAMMFLLYPPPYRLALPVNRSFPLALLLITGNVLEADSLVPILCGPPPEKQGVCRTGL